MPMAVEVTRRRFTADEYQAMGRAGILREDDRVELIDGEVLAMSPIGPPHTGTVNRLTRLFSVRVGETAIVQVQLPVRLDPHSEPQPDLVLLKPRADFYGTAAAAPDDILLAVEVALIIPAVALVAMSAMFYVRGGDGGRGLPGAFVAPGRGSPFPGALAVVSALLFGLWVWRRRGGFANVLALAPVAVVTGIALAWFYGGVAEPTAVRLYLPLAVLGALGPLLLPALVGRAWAGPALLLAAVAFAGWRWSALAAREVLPRPSAAVSLDAVDAALAGLQPDPRRTLLVSTVAQYLIVRGFAAVPPVAFAARAQGLPLSEVIVLETPLDAQLAPQVGDPQALLRGARATLLGRIEGDLPVAAWRLIP